MELIHKDSWRRMATHVFDPKSEELPPSGSIIYTEMEHVYQLFKMIGHRYDLDYILITANSDYSIVHQSKNPVWKDMQKWMSGFVEIDEDAGYNPVIVSPRCNTRFCKIDDVISIKMYSYTGWTMNYEDIPEHAIKAWYSTNNCICKYGLSNIPFGIPDWNYDRIVEKRKLGFHKNQNRKYPFFYSCSFNTRERFNLYNQYKNNSLVYCCKEPLSHEEYVNTLLQSKFVLCPTGNGLDSYRILEALYLGAIPIIINGDNETDWLKAYENISILTANANVDEIWEKYGKKEFNFNLENSTADLTYWSKKVYQSFEKMKAEM